MGCKIDGLRGTASFALIAALVRRYKEKTGGEGVRKAPQWGADSYKILVGT